MDVVVFTFNPFQENTYLLVDKSKECIIVDPGCYNEAEKRQLTKYIEDHDLHPVHLVNTHCHLDHICGNRFVAEKYQLNVAAHKLEKPVLDSGQTQASMFHFPFDASPDITLFLDESDTLSFGDTTLDILFTPGHSPGEICLYQKEEKILIAGDVLFLESIGRTDLPGGDYQTLMQSIQHKLLPLPDDVVVYPGHGPTTTIGHERENNPFLSQLST